MKSTSSPMEEQSVRGHRTKERLLLLLKTRGGMTTRALARALDISVPAVRQHLLSLGDAVSAVQVQAGVGRPPQTWHLTEQAQKNFPDTHSELTVRILDSIEATLGADALDRVIEDRFRKNLDVYRARLDGVDSIAGRLRRLVRIRTEEGYMAGYSRNETGWLLIENHCPICAAASRCQGFCRNELALFQAVLGETVHVERVEYLLEDGQRCVYQITPV